MTCNLSTTGVYFKTHQPLIVGRFVSLTVLLESLNESAKPLYGEGRVVRVERFHGEFGVAVSLTSIRFGHR